MADFYDKVTQLQDITNNIVREEQTRLNNKKTGIESAYASQQRIIALNQSYAMRTRAWSYLLTVIAVAIAISILLLFAKNYLPPTIMDILIIIVMAGAIIWAYLIYMDIQKRDENDYNLLSMKSSSLIDPTVIDAQGAAPMASTTKGDLFGDITGLAMGTLTTCRGQECCAEGQTYDQPSNKCV